MYFEDSEQFKPLVIYPPTHNHTCAMKISFKLLQPQSWCIPRLLYLSDSFLAQSIKRHIKDVPSITFWTNIETTSHESI